MRLTIPLKPNNGDNDSDITGIPTGFIDLGGKTSGLQPSDLGIVAVRPSMGKTAFSANIGEHVAIGQGLPVGFFPMEMSGAPLADRIIGSVGRLDQHHLHIVKLAFLGEYTKFDNLAKDYGY